MQVGRLVAAAALACVPAAPAAAQGAVLQPLKACYVSVDSDVRERMAVAGSGFTPGAVVELSVNGRPAGGGVADDTGSLGPIPVKAPYRPSGVREFTLTAAERDNPANTVELTSKVAALRVRPRPVPHRPRQKIRWVGLGFTGERKVRAHYTRGGVHRRTVTLGRPKGDCGRLDARGRQFPFTPEVGTWRVRFDQQRVYSRTPQGIFYTLKIDVARAG